MFDKRSGDVRQIQDEGLKTKRRGNFGPDQGKIILETN